MPRTASQRSPDGSWLDLVRRGDFAAAWRISDAVLRARAGKPCWHLPRHEQWVWNGGGLDGARVLVRCHHGLGDTILFARYAALLRAVASSVTFRAQPSLIPLLRTASGIDHLLSLHDDIVDAEYDTDIEVMELAHAFRSTVETLPRRVPYLAAEPLDLDALLPPATMRVGLFWRTGDWDDRRDVPTQWIPLLAEVPGVQLCMVARDHEAAGSPPLVQKIPYADDIAGTARSMLGVDLVIAADSMPAHLAGALGVPVWLLLHADPDWRWMIGRDDSPWYPTMRLFRQMRPGDWQPVVERVSRELARHVMAAQDHGHRRAPTSRR